MRQHLLLSMLLAACAGAVPAQQGSKPDKMGAVPGKSVIYLVRGSPDTNWRPADMYLDGDKRVTMYPGTYVRWVVAPCAHRIEGAGADTGQIKLRAEAGKVYFIRQDVAGITAPMSSLQLMNAREGRVAVGRSKPAGGP